MDLENTIMENPKEDNIDNGLKTNDMDMENLIRLVQAPQLLSKNKLTMDMDKNIEMEFLDNEEGRELAGQFGGIFLRHTTLIRDCNENCDQITNNEAVQLQMILLELCSLTG